MIKKAYLEITNACNLSCNFCHKTKRPLKYITEEEFTVAAKKIRPFSEYLYFHLLGEPLLHPCLSEFFDIAGALGFKVILTTNGTLLSKKGDMLLSKGALHKVSISLHAYEANEMGIELAEYLASCFDFCKRAAEKGVIAVMRLWNLGGEDSLNSTIIQKMEEAFPEQWKKTYSGYRLGENKVFLEFGERFEWPDENGEYLGENHTCYGLRDQFGVLSDGTVVPCCLDADGAVPLGNIFHDDLSAILSSERARALKLSLERRCVSEALCLRCGYARQKKY